MQVTVLRDSRKKKCTVDELQNGDIIIEGNLSAAEPYYLRPDLTDLTLRDGNFKNVLLDLPAFLPGIDGVIKSFPAASHTAGWTIEGGLHHVYSIDAVEEAKHKKEREDVVFDRGLLFVETFFDDFNQPVELDTAKLYKAQNTVKKIVEKDPNGVGRLFAKAGK
jgi:hypothetical protein